MNGKGPAPSTLAQIDEADSAQRGLLFERYVTALFEREPGLQVRASDQRSEEGEADLVLWNASAAPELEALGNPVFVECKYLRSPLTEQAVREFTDRLRERGLSSGVLVCSSSVSREAEDLALHFRSERLRVVLLDREDLRVMERGEALRARIQHRLKTLLLAA